jgi:anti-anti-sigma regulatory factor
MRLFEIEYAGRTAILTPVTDLGSLQCQQFASDLHLTIAAWAADTAKNVVIDLRQRYFGPSVQSFFLGLRRVVLERGGRMVVCGLSPLGLQVLRLARLERLLPTCESRDEALALVENTVAQTDALRWLTEPATERAAASILEVRDTPAALVLTPSRELRPEDRDQMDREAAAICQALSSRRRANAVLDLGRTKFFGCTGAAYQLLKVAAAARGRSGAMVLCRASDYEREVLGLSILADCWPIAASLEEALRLLPEHH